MAHRTTWKDKYLGIVIQTILVCGTINISLVFGQTATLVAPALGNSPSGDVFVTYLGDNQNTTAIGATGTLPQCSGTFAGQSNLILRLENTNTGQPLQEVGPFANQFFFLWNTTAIATLTPALTGSYVCRLYQSSSLVTTSFRSYQLNVVVSMQIACQYPTFLNYESMNVISCTVTGYPQPMVSWIGVNGATTTTTPATLSGGIYSITSTLSFVGNRSVSAPGLNAMVDFTAEYVAALNCTMTQHETIQENRCRLIPKTVTETLRPLVAAQCGPVSNPVFNSTPRMAMNYTSIFIFGCATNYTIPGSPDIIPSICQANGIWSPLPNCVLNRCHSSPCMDNASKCTVTIDGNFTCSCQAGTTGDGRLPNGCVMVCTDHCDDKNAVCLENGGLRSCRCKAGYTGRAQAASSCVNINECLLSPCQDCLATCMDTEGSFQCLCPSDFQGNGVERGGCSRGPCSALSTGVIAGASCGSFFLGIVIASLIAWYLTRRKDGGNASSNSRDTQVGKPPVGITMTNSDAYGMVDLPSTQQQQPQYDYILPAAQ